MRRPTEFRDEELLADVIARLIGDVRHVAVGNASPIPATAALLARERGRGRPYVSLLQSRKHNFFTDGARELIVDQRVEHSIHVGELPGFGPGVHLGGCVRVETGAYLGIGSCVVNGRPDEPIIIGKGATVAAGAVVTKSVPAGKTVYGNPAKQKRKRRAGASKNKVKGKKK